MQFVAQETKSQAIDVELLAVKVNTVAGYSIINHSILMDASNMLPQAVDGYNITLERLERQDTVGGISSIYCLNKNLVSWSNNDYVIKSNFDYSFKKCLLMFPLVSHLNNLFSVLLDPCVRAQEFWGMMIIQLIWRLCRR